MKTSHLNWSQTPPPASAHRLVRHAAVPLRVREVVSLARQRVEWETSRVLITLQARANAIQGGVQAEVLGGKP